MIDYVRIFSDSLGRMEAADPEKRDLIGCFYDQFLGSSEEIRRRFDATDLKHQEQMLRDSFKHVLTFSTKRRSNDELERIANRHSRSDLDVRPELYALWLDSLVESVRPSTRSATPGWRRPGGS